MCWGKLSESSELSTGAYQLRVAHSQPVIPIGSTPRPTLGSISTQSVPFALELTIADCSAQNAPFSAIICGVQGMLHTWRPGDRLLRFLRLGQITYAWRNPREYANLQVLSHRSAQQAPLWARPPLRRSGARGPSQRGRLALRLAIVSRQRPSSQGICISFLLEHYAQGLRPAREQSHGRAPLFQEERVRRPCRALHDGHRFIRVRSVVYADHPREYL